MERLVPSIKEALNNYMFVMKEKSNLHFLSGATYAL
jgi:hypothetical protein